MVSQISYASRTVFFQQIIKKQDTARRSNQKTTLPGDTAVKTIGDTTRKAAGGLDAQVEYKAEDSTVVDHKSGMVHLYGKARVNYQGFELDAEYIRYDSKNNLIFARGVYDPVTRKYTGRPIFKMEGQSTSLADSLLYNTKTGKGNVFNPFTEQEGGFFSGGISKKQIDDEIHVKNVLYSTCNLPYPHTHFGINITKGIVTERQIVTGPVYLEVEHVPLPLGLPFGFFPKPNKRSSGIIFPNFGEDATRGFFARDFGYYLGLNDYWDAKLLGTIFTRGSYETSLLTNYTKRYKYNGSLSFRYNNLISGTEGTADYAKQKDFNLSWSHSQNANARPGTTFSASVNLGTSGYFRNSAAANTYDPRAITQNIMNSSISYGKVFGDGKYNFTASLGHSQNTQSQQVDLQLPNFNFSVATFSPFDKKDRVGDPNILQKINVGYSLRGSNSISVKEYDLFKRETLNKFRNGLAHSIPISTNFNVLRYFNFTLSSSINEYWYLQSINKTFFKQENGQDLVRTDTVNGFRRGGDWNLSTSMSTKIYSQANFKSTGKIRALRHVMTPSFSLTYNPDFTDPARGYYKEARYTDLNPLINNTPVLDAQGNVQRYSVFENGIFGGPSARKAASLGFSMDNTVEMKVASSKDTTGTGERKIPIIQGLSVSANYNFVAPNFKLSDIPVSGRSQLSEKLTVNYNANFSPYSVRKDSLGGSVLLDRYTWKDGKLPRLTTFGLSFDYSFNSEAVKSKNKNLDAVKNQTAPETRTQEQIDALNQISRDPNAFVDFNIPWNFAFSYSFQYSNPLSTTPTITNTLNFNGDFNVTPKWKVQFTSGYDFKAKDLAMTNISIYRDLHCWDLSFSWTPFGQYQSYSVDLKVKASILQDLKLSKRKAFYTRF
ncbi:putative LPS assembly protein LptD [Pedobacter yulinensis]|uniref:putative LPS assembly protein LptD n=1 Tax=Pedobacter yulinensis TaxID=2126353 RepID=UPI001EF7AD5C|nr:putative LPS assembly protein LptD [Pedobacter yulinensis]